MLSALKRIVVLLLLAASGCAVLTAAREARKNSAPLRVKIQMRPRMQAPGIYAQANIVNEVMPIYPVAAKKRQIEGIVVLRVVINKDGTVADVDAESGPAELLQVSTDAVKQWRYTPCTPFGRAAEVETEFAIMFTTKGEDFKTVAESSVPIVAVISATTTKLLPPKHPAALRTGKAPFPDTLEGVKAQTQEVLEAFRGGNREKVEMLLDGFALADPTAWFTRNFGAENGPALARDYEIGLEKFKAHMGRVGEAWTKSPTSTLHAENSDVPKPPEEAGEPGGPPKPANPLRIENFRFFITTGQVDPGDWVFSFIYLDGAFRNVGGTHTSWNDNWRLKHDEVSLWTGNSHWQAAYAADSVIEGVASDSPGDGPRVFVAASVEATRLMNKQKPVYPAEARNSGLEGTVLLHAIIAKDGSVKALTVKKGDPIFAGAAKDAVWKWRYQPITYLGRPTEVDTDIAVEFRLSN
ncbi:MAG: energy transducer TonB [Candidatus Acidiferrales bacterium]